MKRRTPVKRRNARRRAQEFRRCYHSATRVVWVQQQPCVNCGVVPSENAHTRGGGMGRKAGFRHICALCKACHQKLHGLGSARAFYQVTGVDLIVEARRIADEWKEAA